MYYKLHEARDKNRLGIVCIVTILAVLAATLWPFNPFPRNRVHWLKVANGIEFEGPGVVISKVPLQAAKKDPQQSCTLEILLRPASITSSSTILSFYTANNPGQFLIRQWRDSLLVRSAIETGGQIQQRKLDVDHALQAGKIILVTIVSGPNATAVYSNGQDLQDFPRFTISPSELSGEIVIGNSPVDYDPWSGDILGLAIYSDELTPEQVFEHYEEWTGNRNLGPSRLSGATAVYSFAERAGHEIHSAIVSGPDLEIPRYFEVPHKALLSSPMKEFQANWEYVKDGLQNVAGFIPLGFVICAYLMSTRGRGRSIFLTIFAAATLSFIIEVLQAYIPRRVSGTTDIFTNTLGAALGAALARPTVVRRFLRK
ncbi:MAG: VanZ family protein [Candidatus Sulfotelmatobacter sp.]